MGIRKEAIQVDVTGADKGARDLDKLGKSADKAADEIQDLGKSFAPYAAGAQKAASSTDELSDELAEASRAAARLDRDLDKLSANSGAKKAGAAGQLLTRQIGGAVSDAIRAIPPQAQGLMLATGAALGGTMAIGMAAAISGAVTGAAGIGAAIAGVALAARSDPRIKAAGAELGKTVMSGLQDSAEPFIGPTLDAIGQIGAAWQRIAPQVSKAFAAAAKYVQPLVSGFTQMAENAIPGIVRAIERAGPVIAVIKHGVAEMGDAIGSFMDSLSENPDEAAAGLQAVLDVVNGLIIGTGKFVSFATSGMEEWTDWSARITGAFEDVVIWPPILRDYMAGLNDEFERLNATANGEELGVMGGRLEGGTRAMNLFGGETMKAADQVAFLNQQLDIAFGKFMSVDQAILGYEASVDALTASFEENGRTIDRNTEKGRANLGAINNVVEAAHRWYEAELRAGDGSAAASDRARAGYFAQLGALRQTLGALGLTSSQIDSLIHKYEQLARPLTKNIRINIQENYTGSNAALVGRAGGFKAFAAGGNYDAGAPRLVGEKGPEIEIPKTSGTIIPANITQRLMRGGGSSGATVGASSGAATITFAGQTDQAFAQLLMKMVRTGMIQLSR
jgi:hypothetical protein